MQRIRQPKKADPFYTSARWRKAREARLQLDAYWCQRCKRHPATMVHHIIPREEAPEKELDMDNLESLCSACHNAEHPEKGEKTRIHPVKVTNLDGLRVYQPK